MTIRRKRAVQTHMPCPATHGPTLPATLSTEEVQLWQAAGMMQREHSLSELATIVKVAEAYQHDSKATWLQCITSRTIATDWSSDTQSSETLRTLLSLPPHLLPHIMSTWLTARPLVSLFPALPARLQPHLIAAAVAQSNFTLSIPNFPHCPEAFIATLATTPLPAPGLRALALPKPSTSLICQHSKGYSTASAALLARAAAAHTTLATLDLSGTHLTGDWFVTFGNALTPSSLPHLRTLWVSCHTLSGGAAELAALLQKLPALEDFAAYLGMLAHTADASDAMSCTHASAAPVVLPNLKRMHLRELLSLQRFRSAADLERGNASCAHFLLPLIQAPALTSLTFKLRCGSTVLPEFFSALREFTALREVRGHIPWHRDVTDVYSAFSPYALPTLRSVDLTSHCPVSPVPAAAALASYAGAALTRLSVSVVPRGPTDHVAPVPMEDAEDAWTALWEGVRYCGNLQELNLGDLRSLGPNRQAAEVFDSVARNLRPHLAPDAASLGA